MPDYQITFTVDGTSEIGRMTVFEVETEEQALEEVERSLSIVYTGGYTINSVVLLEDPS